MRILFASGSMLGGGAERVVSLLSNHFVKRGWEVSILVVRGDSVFPLEDRVRMVQVYNESEITTAISNKILRRLNYLPRLIRKIRNLNPDVIVPVHGGGWNGLFVLIAKTLGVKVIAAEHIGHTVGQYNILRWIERHLVYLLADQVTVLSKFDYDYYKNFIHKLTLLPNPIGFQSVSGTYSRAPVLLAAGRLNSWSHKGFDNLLQIFAAVSPSNPEWRLQIAGHGDEGKAYLKQLANELGISDKVQFLGFQKDIDRIMQQASIFVLSSRFEGLPMVLVEAMSQGCACISYDCEAGPADIITDGVDGILVPNQDHAAMTEALKRLMADDALRLRLASTGLAKVEQYSLKSIGQKWLDMFRNLKLTS